MMIENLKIVSLAYCEATNSSVSAVSVAIFGKNDRNRIRRILDSGGIGLKTFEQAMNWFWKNWPEDAPWPNTVHWPLWTGKAPTPVKPSAVAQ